MRFETPLLQKCWFLAGPTACGKTAVGVALAERLRAEVVALDSMSLYRGMDIGTAKPSADERARVPHHLIDVLEPHQSCSVAEYLRAAHDACRRIVDRGRTPLFVGGTGLYLRAVLRGVFEGPSADWGFRQRLEADAAGRPADWLHEQLAAVDPATARRLPPRDVRRIVRALEIHHLTGHPASELRQQLPLPPEERPRHVYWLHPPRDWLRERIDRRVDSMLAAGFVEEVRSLVSREQPLSRTAAQALGYREMIDHLEGRCTLPEAVRDIQQHTRQFAKRQHTWFRNLIECTPIAMTGPESPEELAGRIHVRAEGAAG
jgi:tRNA dimethylallyltransferase